MNDRPPLADEQYGTASVGHFRAYAAGAAATYDFLQSPRPRRESGPV
jgi:hypothetical protein